MPAWLIPGRRRTWAIVVHGLNGTPLEGLRIAPTLHRAGLPTLLISYREDLGAPASPDGFHHQGLTEWRDLGAAARYALAHGARHLVLAGYSMGGAIIAQFMERSPLAARVSGLVLDAPVLDWRAAIEFNATEMGFPSFAALPVEWAIDARTDVDWDRLDANEHTGDFHLPTLLFHGTDDEAVPISTSDEFAAALPHWVTYYRVPDAGHTESWNVEPTLYERRLDTFLDRAVPQPRNTWIRNRGTERSGDRRALVRPGPLGLELGREREQGRLVAGAADDLDRERHAVGGEAGRYRHRRVAEVVPGDAVRIEAAHAEHGEEGAAPLPTTHRQRRAAHHRGHQDVMGVEDRVYAGGVGLGPTPGLLEDLVGDQAAEPAETASTAFEALRIGHIGDIFGERRAG